MESIDSEAAIPLDLDAEKDKKKSRKRKKSLHALIRKQMEFYFSDSNLMKDKFLSQLIYDNSKGLVPLDVFFNFNRIRTLNCTKNDICRSLLQSEILQVTEDKQHVRRVTTVNAKTNVDQCTLYVENLPPETDHDWLNNTFSPFGKIDYISLPRFKLTNKVKGFSFVEFSTAEEAKKASKHFGCSEEDGKEVVEENMEQTPKSKRKRGTSESSDSGKKRSRHKSTTEPSIEEVQIPAPTNDDNVVLESEEAPAETESRKEKRKRMRKKKPKYREEHEKPVQTLRVMPKEVWKRWKNKYLSMQKATMCQIKMSLSGVEAPAFLKENKQPQRKNPGAQGASQTENIPAEKKVKKKDRPLKMMEGVVVRLKMKQPIENPAHIKAQLRTLGNVAYVDVKEGERLVYMRCSSPQETQRILSVPDLPGRSRLLAGEEELEYWRKIEAERQAKFSGQTNIRRPKKVLTKIDRKQSAHTIFTQ